MVTLSRYGQRSFPRISQELTRWEGVVQKDWNLIIFAFHSFPNFVEFVNRKKYDPNIFHRSRHVAHAGTI